MSKNNSSKLNKKKTEREPNSALTAMKLRSFPSAAIAIASLDKTLDFATILESLEESIERVLDGKTTEIEAMLITQAKTLEYLFNDALRNLASSEMEYAEVYANIAFRAQNQSRKALMALAELKSPRRTMFIKQQNNAVNQQVNNVLTPISNNCKNSKKVTNELLKEASHETLDFQEKTDVINVNSEMELIKIDRSQK